MIHTDHSKKRMQQRGINSSVVQTIFEFGEKTFHFILENVTY